MAKFYGNANKQGKLCKHIINNKVCTSGTIHYPPKYVSQILPITEEQRIKGYGLADYFTLIDPSRQSLLNTKQLNK